MDNQSRRHALHSSRRHALHAVAAGSLTLVAGCGAWGDSDAPKGGQPTTAGNEDGVYTVRVHNTTEEELPIEIEIDYALGATPTDTTDPEPPLSVSPTLSLDGKQSWDGLLAEDGDYVLTAEITIEQSEVFEDIAGTTLRIDSEAADPPPGTILIELVRAKDHIAWRDRQVPSEFQPGYGIELTEPDESR